VETVREESMQEGESSNQSDRDRAPTFWGYASSPPSDFISNASIGYEVLSLVKKPDC
jgi:hypothetical protein